MSKLRKIEDKNELLKLALGLENEVVRLQSEVARLKKTDLDGQQQKISFLEELIAQQNHRLYGDSSERTQNATDVLTSQDKPPAKEKKGHGPTPQPQLPVEEIIFEVDEADRCCPKCGDDLENWEGHFEESQTIQVIEAHYRVHKNKRQKMRCKRDVCGHIETAIGPMKLRPRSRYSPEFCAHVAVQKYADHLPLDRQARIMKRQGLKIDSQTLWDRLLDAHEVLKPLEKAILKQVMQHDVIGADETTWRLLKKGAKKSYVWAFCVPNAVYYTVAGSRAAVEVEDIFKGFCGHVMADDYSVYKSLEKNSEMNFTLVGCWAHVRRKFLEAQKNEPQKVLAIVSLINAMYRVDRQAVGPPGSSLSDSEKMGLLGENRQSKTKPILEALKVWSLFTEGVLPESAFGKAIAYMKSCWPKLVLFAEDARLSLDNNATERALRGVVLGRKNHYGSRSHKGMEVAGFFYSLIETLKLNDVNPQRYMLAAMTDAVNRREIVLPWEFVDNRQKENEGQT